MPARPRWLAAIAAVPLPVMPASAAATHNVTVSYRPLTTWSTVNIHYAATGGSWTTVPGMATTALGGSR